MNTHRYSCAIKLVTILILFFCAPTFSSGESGVYTKLRSIPKVVLPKSGLLPSEIAVIVNVNDRESIEIGEYYREKRRVPSQNIIKVDFNAHREVITEKEFNKIKDKIDKIVPDNVQAFALAWMHPYRVNCMSITTAFALGYSKDYCAIGCKPTKKTSYFNSTSHQPFKDFGLRPTMMLAGHSVKEVKELIDRGVASDSTYPTGKGYLVQTSDKARNTRAFLYDQVIATYSDMFDFVKTDAEYIEGKSDVLFYFIGAANVLKIESNRFLPGAIADHLTSAGGALFGKSQMSILQWIKAGATASYGAVVEPCNFPQKFPNPGVVAGHYLTGESLIEAYWKSVQMPGQGVFVGEPLARPYGGYKYNPAEKAIEVYSLSPGIYYVETAKHGVGPYKKESKFIKNNFGRETIKLSYGEKVFYRVVREGS